MPEKESTDAIYEVEDSDDFVARKKKKMIMQSREQVNSIETQLALGGTPKEMNVRPETAYHQIVRQFLRNIEPLLSNPDVSGATEAYQEAFLGYITIQPPVDPTAKQSKPTHLQNNSAKQQFQEKDNSDLVLHRFSDPVEAETFEITGLQEIIASEGRTTSWDVIIDKKESRRYSGGGMKEMTVTESKQWDYPILNNAVRVADQFLENANIGLSLSEGEPTDGFLDL